MVDFVVAMSSLAIRSASTRWSLFISPGMITAADSMVDFVVARGRVAGYSRLLHSIAERALKFEYEGLLSLLRFS